MTERPTGEAPRTAADRLYAHLTEACRGRDLAAVLEDYDAALREAAAAPPEPPRPGVTFDVSGAVRRDSIQANRTFPVAAPEGLSLDVKRLARAMAIWSDPEASADEIDRSATFYETSAQETLDIYARLSPSSGESE